MGVDIGTVVALSNKIIPASALANFPTTGSNRKLYVDEGSNVLYRWSGTQYTMLTLGSSSLTFVGIYDASAGTPNAETTLTTNGQTLIVSVAGEQTIDSIAYTGANQLNVGDLLVETSGGIRRVPFQTAVFGNVTSGRIPLITNGAAGDSSLRETSTQIISDKSLVVPQGSIGIGAGVTLSEVGGIIESESNVTGNRYSTVMYPTSQDVVLTSNDRPIYFQLADLDNTFLFLNDDSTNTTITSFDYSPPFSFINHGLTLNFVNAVTNLRIRITSNETGDVVRYFPSREAWESGTGVSASAGEQTIFTAYQEIDGENQLPFAFTQGVTYTNEYMADQAVVVLGDGSLPWARGNIRRVTVTEVASMSDVGSDDDAIHDNVAGEINAVTLKSNVVNNDVFLIEDSEDSFNKKRVTISSVTGGTPPVTPVPSVHNFSIDIADIVDTNTGQSGYVDIVNGSREVTFGITNHSRITSLALQLNGTDIVTLTNPTTDGTQTQTVTLSGIDLTSDTDLVFRLQINDSINSNTDTKLVRTLTQAETAYYGVSDDDNDDTINVATLTSRRVRIGDVFQVTFELEEDDYAIFLIPNTLAITSLIEQTFNQSVLADFTMTDDVRTIGSVTYDSYVLQNEAAITGDLILSVTIGGAS